MPADFQQQRCARGTHRPCGPCRTPLVRVTLLLLGALLAGCSLPAPVATTSVGEALRVLTFNVGSDRDTDEPAVSNGGFGPEQAAIANHWYGNGLSWLPVIAQVREFLRDADADIVALQEVFPIEQCAHIPPQWHGGFVCETWTPGAPSVPRRILGEDYQIACHEGKPDKCLAVHRRLGQLRGCNESGCAPLPGVELDGCGSGSRQGLALVELHAGGALGIGHVHGRSGGTWRDARCRSEQFDTLLMPDGELHPPTARAIVLGDFNTDPARVRWVDPSARRLARATRAAESLRFISRTGLFARPTFLRFLNIDHVLARGFSGECLAGGRDAELAAPSDIRYLDHSPLLCELWPQEMPAASREEPARETAEQTQAPVNSSHN